MALNLETAPSSTAERLSTSDHWSTDGAHGLLPTDILDAVRGAAATYVMLFHARFLLLVGVATGGALTLHGPWRSVVTAATAAIRHGHAAVLLFFLVSGYAIHYRQAFRIAKDEKAIISWPSYFLHRARRLYPPLLAALAITCVLDTIGTHLNPSFYGGVVPADVRAVFQDLTHQLSPTALIGTLLFVQNIATPLFGSDVPLWSLAFEGFFYLTYPLVLAVSLRFGATRCLLIYCAIGLGAALAISLVGQIGILSLVAYWPLWVAGAFIADVRAARVKMPRHYWTVALAVSPFVVGLFIATGRRLTTSVQQTTLWHDYLWALVFLAVLGWLAAEGHTAVARRHLLAFSRPLSWLGTMSYSLYVVHCPVFVFLSALWLRQHQTLPATPWLFLAGVAAALTTAFGLYLVAERPVVTSSRRARARAS